MCRRPRGRFLTQAGICRFFVQKVVILAKHDICSLDPATDAQISYGPKEKFCNKLDARREGMGVQSPPLSATHVLLPPVWNFPSCPKHKPCLSISTLMRAFPAVRNVSNAAESSIEVPHLTFVSQGRAEA